jgi:hypothetical protein
MEKMNSDLTEKAPYYLNLLDNENDEIKCVTSVFTIFFEDPFWVGILEENYNGINYMGKHIFGAEPSNSELLQFYIYEFENINKLNIGEIDMETKRMNFKKSMNKSKKAQNKIGVGTKSQNLFKKAFEETMKRKKKEKKIDEIINKEEKYIKELRKKLKRRRGIKKL